MATLAYPYSVRDSANSSTDNRKTGLTPTVSAGKTLAASPAAVLASTVTVVEVGAGDYVALYDAETNLDASFPVDWGSSLTNPNDRYGTLILTRDAGRVVANLDAAVSTRMATYAQPTGFLAATFPATVASPTNITAGTITTVSNLTTLPAPPTDWLTAAATSAGAVTKIQAGLSTYAGGNVTVGGYASNQDPATLVWAAGSRTLTDKAGFSLNLGQSGLTFRDQGAVADASLTVGDALAAALCGATGKESVSGTSYVVKTPSTGTVIRTFTLDSATAPTTRS